MELASTKIRTFLPVFVEAANIQDPMAFSPSKTVKRLDAFALWITNQVGTMGFFGIIILWTMSWLIWNTLAPPALRFDPYPAFGLWLFLCNMLQIFLMPLLMLRQNLDARNSKAKTPAHFVMNIKTEQEVEQILLYLDSHYQCRFRQKGRRTRRSIGQKRRTREIDNKIEIKKQIL
jgi:uncharacterized membrane protein